jgi:RNA polymerase sigma factor (sigma-70 family)
MGPAMGERPDDPRACFRALYDAHGPALLAYALRRVAAASDAADVVAETFLVAWRRLDDVPAGDEARLWLFGVARRVLANRRRGEQRRHRLADRLRQELDRRIDPSRSDGAIGRAASVQEALDRLDEQDRELLRLTAWERLSPTELAAVFGVLPATMRTRLHRARLRLRIALEAVEGTNGGTVERSDVTGHVSGGGRPLAQGLPEER